MDSFELNKVAGALLGTLLFAFGTGFLAELIYHPRPAGNRGWDLPGGSAEHGGGEKGGAEKKETETASADSIAARLAHADVEKGKAGTKACQGCHSFEEGGGNKVGPHLYDVVERKKGSASGFDYSAGLKEKGGTWTYDDLDAFLTKPSAYIKGTKMSYAGIQASQERANVIAYLRSLSKDPKPLPAAEKAEGKKDEGKKDEGKGADKKDDGKKTENAAPPEKGADKPAKAEAGGGGLDNGQPATPSSPTAAEPARKPDKAAEEKAKQEESGHNVGGPDKPAQ